MSSRTTGSRPGNVGDGEDVEADRAIADVPVGQKALPGTDQNALLGGPATQFEDCCGGARTSSYKFHREPGAVGSFFPLKFLPLRRVALLRIQCRIA